MSIIVLTSGRTITAGDGVLGISPEGRVYSGYDNAVHEATCDGGGCHCGYERGDVGAPMNAAERRELADHVIARWQQLKEANPVEPSPAEVESYAWLLGGLSALIEDGHGLQLVTVLCGMLRDRATTALTIMSTVVDRMANETLIAREKRTTNMQWGNCDQATRANGRGILERHNGIPCRECGAQPEPS